MGWICIYYLVYTSYKKVHLSVYSQLQCFKKTPTQTLFLARDWRGAGGGLWASVFGRWSALGRALEVDFAPKSPAFWPLSFATGPLFSPPLEFGSVCNFLKTVFAKIDQKVHKIWKFCSLNQTQKHSIVFFGKFTKTHVKASQTLEPVGAFAAIKGRALERAQHFRVPSRTLFQGQLLIALVGLLSPSDVIPALVQFVKKERSRHRRRFVSWSPLKKMLLIVF